MAFSCEDLLAEGPEYYNLGEFYLPVGHIMGELCLVRLISNEI